MLRRILSHPIAPLIGVPLGFVVIIAINEYRKMPSYPYGWSHSCLKGVGLALLNYADAYGGQFPMGEATPEASLSLLYREHFLDAEWLRGKTVPLETVQAILNRGELLGPESCGWHYVEGLKVSDDHRVAIVWDKVGLGHNGQALPEGSHSVLFVAGSEEVILGKDWPHFLAEQESLLQARKTRRPIVVDPPRLAPEKERAAAP